ncbi:MAG: phosphoserine phosphatase SerB [Pseudomonadota bacterium]
MHIASLIARPGTLTPEIAEGTFKALLCSSETDWLAPLEAAEAPLPSIPPDAHSIWRDLQTAGVDFNILPATNRKKKILLADMDSTMIEQECLDELAIAAGVGDQVVGITKRAMNGELDFEEALEARVALLDGQPEALIEEVLATKITYMPGGDVLLKTMKAAGAYAALVSGGFTDFTSAVAAHLDFDEHRANTLLRDCGNLTGKTGKPVLGRDAKVTALTEIATRLGLSADDVLAVGDGANDLGMLTAAGLGVAAHAKPTVQDQAPMRINHGDLTALLYLQGYFKTDFEFPKE